MDELEVDRVGDRRSGDRGGRGQRDDRVSIVDARIEHAATFEQRKVRGDQVERRSEGHESLRLWTRGRFHERAIHIVPKADENDVQFVIADADVSLIDDGKIDDARSDRFEYLSHIKAL